MTVRELVSRWPLVGRERELEAFAGFWGSRRCRGVVVCGAAGVGKTRLAEEFLEQAVREGFRARRATASAAAAAVPLGAIAHLIPAGVDLSDPVAGFAEVARVLAGRWEQERRYVLLIDDLHLLDAASAVLLRQLLDAGVVRLIGTVRTEEPVSEAVEALCGEDAVHRVDLGTFTVNQVDAVLQAALGGMVARRAVHELFTASGGNVLYLRELVLGALADGLLADDGEIWGLAEGRMVGTPRLAELIGSRLAGADASARPVLELLALCEPLPLSDAGSLATVEMLAGLEETGLVRVHTDRRRTSVSLAHPLYGEVLRVRLPELRRRELLLAQAERTKAYGAHRRDDALHIAVWQLAVTGTAEPAQLVQAAALARHAHDYERALTLLDALPDEEHTTATRLMLGEVLFELGNPQRAEEVLAAADTDAEGEQEVLAVALARTRSLFWSAARTSEALAINDAVRSRVTSTDGLRMLRYSEGAVRIASSEPARGLALLEDLADDINDAADPVAWLTAAMMKPVGLALVGRTGEAVAFAERAHAAHLTVDDRTLYVHPATQLVVLSYALRSHGRLAEARAVGERAYAELTAADIRVPRAWMAANLGRVEWLAGHPAAARRWYAEAVALARAHHNLRPMCTSLSGLAVCAAVLGDLEAAEQAYAEARTYPSSGLDAAFVHLVPAWIAAARGNLTQARAVLADAAAKARAAGLITSESLLLTDIARFGAAKDVAGRLAELAELSDGALTPAQAHLAAALAVDDPGLLLAAADELQAIGADLMAAEAATAAAAARRRTGATRRAAAATQLARRCAARCPGARTPLLVTAETAAPLTARQRDVALLAAHGTTSRDIADALHLSVRTVDNHLQAAYTKLGVTTRRELAQALGTTTRHPNAVAE